MCGFVGKFDKHQETKDCDLLKASALIKSRGPDESTKYSSNELSIYFHHLAIVGKNGSVSTSMVIIHIPKNIN